MKYIIKVEPAEGCNPEYAPDREMTEGIETDGFVIIGFRDGKPHFESIMGVSLAVMSKWIRQKAKGAQLIRQACAIAEGEIRAEEIGEEKDGNVILTGAQIPIGEEILRRILGKE